MVQAEKVIWDWFQGIHTELAWKVPPDVESDVRDFVRKYGIDYVTKLVVEKMKANQTDKFSDIVVDLFTNINNYAPILESKPARKFGFVY